MASIRTDADGFYDPMVHITPYQEYLRRTLPTEPHEKPRHTGPYFDEEQARDQFESDAHHLGIASDADLVRANRHLLCEALADADVAVTEYELEELRNLASHDYATIQVIIGWIWRAAGISNPTTAD